MTFSPNFFSFFFRPIFKCYLLLSLWTDWLQISCEASWDGALLQLWKLCWLSIFCLFCNCFFIFSAQFSNFLKILGRLTSNFMWGIVGRVSTNVMEIMLMQQFCQRQGRWASCYDNAGLLRRWVLVSCNGMPDSYLHRVWNMLLVSDSFLHVGIWWKQTPIYSH